jgi:hypothetical protein
MENNSQESPIETVPIKGISLKTIGAVIVSTALLVGSYWSGYFSLKEQMQEISSKIDKNATETNARFVNFDQKFTYKDENQGEKITAVSKQVDALKQFLHTP